MANGRADGLNSEEPSMQPSSAGRPAPRSGYGDRPTIGVLMAIIAGIALGMWVLGKAAAESNGPLSNRVLIWVVTALGCLSVMGVPILLFERFRGKGPPNWGAGRLSWFAQSTAAWLLWPPIVAGRFRQPAPGEEFVGEGAAAGICYYYGTPLMAVYVGAALIFGGALRKSRRRRIRRSFRESFGLALAVLWAATGLYILGLIYTNNLR